MQHLFVAALVTVLPTRVLGNPRQDIFGFLGNQLVDWDMHMLQQFPLIGELNRPWLRIKDERPLFGNKLLDRRCIFYAAVVSSCVRHFLRSHGFNCISPLQTTNALPRH